MWTLITQYIWCLTCEFYLAQFYYFSLRRLARNEFRRPNGSHTDPLSTVTGSSHFEVLNGFLKHLPNSSLYFRLLLEYLALHVRIVIRTCPHVSVLFYSVYSNANAFIGMEPIYGSSYGYTSNLLSWPFPSQSLLVFKKYYFLLYLPQLAECEPDNPSRIS